MLRRFLRPAILLLAVLAPLARAQPDEDGPVRVRAIPQRTTVKAGDRVAIAVELTHAPKHHTWPAAHVPLPPVVSSFAERTAIGVDAGTPKDVRALGVQWPDAHPGQVPNLETGKGTMTVPLYSGTATAYLVAEIAPGARAGQLMIPVHVHYQVCNDQACLMPEDVSIPVSLTVGAESGMENEPALFAGFKPGEIGQPLAPPPAEAALPAAPRTIFGITIGGGLVLLFLAAALGGVILNLTPCVLPIIPLKIMALVHHAGSPGRRLILGLWMALGVVAFWSALAIPVLALRSAGHGDPSQLIFGTWWLTLAIGLLIAVMGLGIMGLFTIQLPQSVYAINPKADTAWGSFLFGVMAGVLGLPCFGFVAGGLLAGLVAMPWDMVVTIFVGLGVGMGAPYLILAVWPALIERIPRTGPASELVKQVMGLLLLAFAGFFIASGIGAVLKTMPFLSKSIHIWVVAFFVALTALWLTVRTLQIARRAWPRVIMPAISLLAAAGFISWIARGTSSDRRDWIRLQAASEDTVVSGAWLEYTPRRLEKAIASGKIIVADFTADWCLTCKFLKRTILDDEPLASRLRQDDVILLEVDCTVDTSPDSALLASLRLTGVPHLAVWAPAEKVPMVVLDAYTSGVVLEALDAAKKKAGGSKSTESAPSVSNRAR
jgi:thiol:disulfide interchange protein DsbD